MGTLLAACLTLAGVNLTPRLTAQPTQLSAVQPDVLVSVAGAVHQPGMYNLPWGATVADAVGAAGGLTLAAEPKLVNLAEPLDTGRAVYVPFRQTEEGTERISINSASARQLQDLPRIGPAMAERIIEARPFHSVDDLLRVRGIGPKTLEQLRPLVTM